MNDLERVGAIVDAMVNDADKELELTKDGLARFVRRTTRMGLTGEDAAKLAAYKSVLFHQLFTCFSKLTLIFNSLKFACNEIDCSVGR